jgi:Rrf2 family transcriptional regulator, cysteine metabolism repressor
MAAVDLAMHIGTAPVQAKSIAHRQAIPARFLEQVLHGMKKAGLVSSLRGAQGGYVLSKKPSEVSIVEILEALDGPLSPLNGGASRAQGRRLGKPELLLGKIWEQVHQAERHVLEAISVEELAGQQRVIEQERTLMYHI